MVNIDKIETFVVIGAGTMGREIAQVALMSELFKNVILNDINKSILDNATIYIENGIKKMLLKGLPRENVSSESLMEPLIKDYNLAKSIHRADFIVEAIPEVMELKQDLFRDLGNLAPSQAILATNTSTMSITKIAEASNRPQQVVGMHFFIPIPVLRLIEVIKGEKTSQETFDTAVELGKRMPALKGKRYIAKIDKESPGFIVNRLTIASSLLLNRLLDIATERGIAYEKVDNDFVSPPEWGPYIKWDYLGLDVIWDSLNYFAKTLSPEFAPGRTLTNLVKEGNLGKKTGKGLYEWKEGKPIIQGKGKANLANPEFYYAIQLNEGCRLLKEGIVSNYKTIDDTMLAGMDMPGPFGPGKNNYIKWSNMLEELSDKIGITYIKPCELMKTGNFIKMK
ncbi:MAG: 3-hydroxyacyl-CoA dehydrogenase family protein [Promethearchaeota archaeon]